MQPEIPRVACRRPARAGIALVALLAVLGLGTQPAAADACASGPKPTLADLQRLPTFSLDLRGGLRDYYEVDAGECRALVTAAPEVRVARAWLVLRGSGAVWSCPSGSAQATFTVTVTAADVREWSLSSEVSLGGEVLGVGLSASITSQVRSRMSLSTTTTLTQALSAGYCRTIGWGAYFEVAELTTEVPVAVSRRWAWWTKNRRTGAKVHRKGDIWVAGGTTTARLDARAPLNGHFRLRERICSDPECRGLTGRGDLGFVVPLQSLPFVDRVPPIPLEEAEEPEGPVDDASRDEAPAPGDTAPTPGDPALEPDPPIVEDGGAAVPGDDPAPSDPPSSQGSDS